MSAGRLNLLLRSTTPSQPKRVKAALGFFFGSGSVTVLPENSSPLTRPAVMMAGPAEVIVLSRMRMLRW